jgi:ABC-type transport system substrate-binding protein
MYFGDPLLQMGNATRKLVANVIEKWEQPDKTTLVLKVRPGVKFFNMAPANGRELEAKDIVYTIRSMTGSLYPDAKIPFPRKSLFEGASDPVVVDKSTVRMQFSTPRSDILYSLAEDRIAVLPEGLREHFGGFDSLQVARAERLVGTGPFIAEKIDNDTGNTWRRNPDYWNKPFPYLETAQSVVVRDIQSWVAALIAGQNHYVERVTPELVDVAKRGLGDVQVATHASNSFRRVSFNTRTATFKDVRVRKAIGLMFDKPGFSAAIFGKEYWKYPGPMPFLFPESLTQEELAKMPLFRSPTAEDITEAKALLNAAGLGSGFTTSISAAQDIPGTPAFKQVGEHLKEQVEKNLPGVKVNIDGITYTQVLAKIAKPDGWDMATISAFPEISPVNNMAVFYHSKGGRNNSGLVNPKMDALIQSAFEELDEAKRTQLLRDAQVEAIATVPDIWTHTGLSITIMRPEVRGLDLGGTFDAHHSVRYAWLKA